MAVPRGRVVSAAGKHRVLIFGRGRQADIRLNHPSISRFHGELVLGAGGEIHLADRSSANGIWILAEGVWERVTSREVGPDDRVRLGTLEVTVGELISRVPERRNREDKRVEKDLPAGRVRRNRETGEVIPG